jgi:acetyl-CoA carboxylase biotin carboxyl carrier protein
MAEQVTAPMVGKVLEVQCKVGDQVSEDDVILLLEAMKMEIPVVAPVSGTIKELKVAAGDTVEAETVLAIIE